ncbi:MAG: polysaccharide pyruvyl transferase family protein [Alphaproteobacteria bacterium]
MKFGLLSYKGTFNLGDEIQSLAARRLLPRVDSYLDRDDLSGAFAGDGEPTALIVHGWMSHTPENWPPQPAIRPLLTSLHLARESGKGPARISASEFMLAPPIVDYLKSHGAVGARDLATLQLLESHGVEAYFSGCLSLTLSGRGLPRGANIVLNDVPERVASAVAAGTTRQISRTTHGNSTILDPAERFSKAQDLLDEYESAHCVITTKLHCALPCLAFGTPVLLLDVAPDQHRFSGLNDYLRHCSEDDFLANRGGFPLESPEPNRSDFTRLREPLIATVNAFVQKAQDGTLSTSAWAAQFKDSASGRALRFATLAHVYARAIEKLADAEKQIAALTSANQDLAADTNRLQSERDNFARMDHDARAACAALEAELKAAGARIGALQKEASAAATLADSRDFVGRVQRMIRGVTRGMRDTRGSK